MIGSFHESPRLSEAEIRALVDSDLQAYRIHVDVHRTNVSKHIDLYESGVMPATYDEEWFSKAVGFRHIMTIQAGVTKDELRIRGLMPPAVPNNPPGTGRSLRNAKYVALVQGVMQTLPPDLRDAVFQTRDRILAEFKEADARGLPNEDADVGSNKAA